MDGCMKSKGNYWKTNAPEVLAHFGVEKHAVVLEGRLFAECSSGKGALLSIGCVFEVHKRVSMLT